MVTDFLEEGSDNWKMLADTSLLLLLLFTNYCTDTSAFRNLNTEAHFRLSYPALFSVLADIMHAVTQLSLGGLLILVVIRTIQYNTHQMRDKYLHTIYLPALANMSATQGSAPLRGAGDRVPVRNPGQDARQAGGRAAGDGGRHGHGRVRPRRGPDEQHQYD